MVRLTDRPDMTLDVYGGRKNNNATIIRLLNHRMAFLLMCVYSFLVCVIFCLSLILIERVCWQKFKKT